ncbi:hypothetical protein BD311DRAFT_814134 [Dichomitus squalens]|uniref:Uncharacterized protein n=1 Tax=Dichomitus squalens TaxID=114155 RepID=A0A4Q9N9V7_9APHY|nr:hypothetical protein BD311DRAFT_814134 [Dichomitus squalens]
MFEGLPQSCETRNPFIVLRFVLLGILAYINILTIGFAAWNLTVLRDLDVHVLGSPTFVLFNSCLLLTLLAFCFASSRFPVKFINQVRYECAWTGALSTLQLGGCVAVTANGPPVLCQGISIVACASSSLVVALSWISCMILILYSFSLLTTTVTHMHVVADIWMSSVREVPWFVGPSTTLEYTPRVARTEKARHSDVLDIKRLSFHYPTPIFEQFAKPLPPSPQPGSAPPSPIWPHRQSIPDSPHAPPPVDRRSTWTSRLLTNTRPTSLAHKQSKESMRPSWAKRVSPRRGVDAPFAMPPMPRFSFRQPVLPPVRPLRPLKLKSCWSQTTVNSPPPVPALPQKAVVVGGPGLPSSSPTGSFYIDLERDAVVPVGDTSRPVSYGMFPEDVGDPDQPVTRARLSQWVRAGSETSSTR